jgi:hypothetical protein
LAFFFTHYYKSKKKESHLGDSPDHQGASTSHDYIL